MLNRRKYVESLFATFAIRISTPIGDARNPITGATHLVARI